ncbi:MAG: HAMP domain-containing protein/HPt (histidine-containing phosphotransfer) domain-containing protein [Pseudohongiellaceae bacterium]|jgi:HAMP domain-containing protein
MRLTVGFKIGSGFFLVTLMLLIAGFVGYMGALKLGASIENIGTNAMTAAQSSSDFSIATKNQTSVMQSIVSATTIANADRQALIASEAEDSLKSLTVMHQSGLVEDADIKKIRSFYDNYLLAQKHLLEAHSNYIHARDNAFTGFDNFESFMKVLEFFTNQIYNLPNIDQDEKIELTAEFYQTKVALQLRFYYAQRYLGGEDAMLDSLEFSEDDMYDEAEELADLDLLSNTIRTGKYENQEYADVLNDLVAEHNEHFKQLVTSYKLFKEVQSAYEKAEKITLENSKLIVDKIKNLVSIETTSASDTASTVYKTILIAIAVGVLLAIIATIFSIIKVVSPLKVLTEVAARISGGDLDAEVKSGRNDEVGDLANNFDSMRIQIRKKLKDLAEINQTGEIIVSAVNQEEALQKALETMFNKTLVQQASVYLFDDNRLTLKTCVPPISDISPDNAITFDPGEGIAGISVKEKRIVFVKDTSKSDLFIKNIDTESPKALLCVPLLDGNKALGVMNFSGAVGTVNFEESDYEFAESIARSVAITIKNIGMREVIEEQNRTLEQKVEERTLELQIKTNDILSMMENMHQGLFTVMDEGVIHHEYASFLETIFERSDIAGNNFMDLLFSKSKLGSDQLDQVTTAINAIIGEEAMMWEFNSHLLVNEYTIDIGGAEKIISIEWDPIIFDDVIVKVMVTVRDITELKALERDAEGKKRELAIISQIISVDQEKFAEFIKSAYQFLGENAKLIEKCAQKDPEVLSLLFRNMHTIKGNARTYGLSTITDQVHNAENTYDSLRTDDSVQWDQKRLTNELQLVESIIEEYVHVCENVLSRDVKSQNEEQSFNIKRTELDTIFNLVESLSESTGLDQTFLAKVSQVKSIIKHLNSISFSDAISDTCDSLKSIAEQLNKTKPKIQFTGGDIQVNKESTNLLNNVFSHILRNSMDHGIETPDVRVVKGKDAHGTISIDVKELNDLLLIQVKDDGQGLNLEKLRKTGIKVGLIKEGESPSLDQLASLIFESGVSTKTDVTSISGRGVGMDAVKKFIEEKGGSVTIQTKDSIDGSEFINFETVIKLPLNLV